jgi:hypothetical protein
MKLVEIQPLYTFCLWTTSLDESWIKANIANVRTMQHVGEESVKTQAVATMWERAVLSLIQEPVVWLRVDSVLLETVVEQVVVLNPHRTTDNFTDVRQQQIDRLGKTCVVRIAFHVERLDFCWEPCKQYRLIYLVGHFALRCFWYVLETKILIESNK